MFNSVGDDIEDEDGDEEEEEEEERPMTLKYWQLRRLARALKTGHCKNSVKSLAAELFLDRAVVLDLLRDTPLNLVMMSAAMPDEPGTEVKVPIHVMQGSWFARKRLKKVHVDTPYSVYRRTRRPTNSMISNIVRHKPASEKSGGMVLR
nr:protein OVEREXPRESSOR OF CATIONIC PEROXIDASE 3-like [Populus alba]